MATIVLAISGYETLIPGNFKIDTFLLHVFFFELCLFSAQLTDK